MYRHLSVEHNHIVETVCSLELVLKFILKFILKYKLEFMLNCYFHIVFYS